MNYYAEDPCCRNYAIQSKKVFIKNWRTIYIYILTCELAEYIKDAGLSNACEQLGISDATLGRFRRELQIQTRLGSGASQHDWMMIHLDELFSDRYYVLEQKYGLHQQEVERYCRYLLHRGTFCNCEVRDRK